MTAVAVAVFARAPSAAGKSRLAAHLPEPRLRALREALLADAIHAVDAAADVDKFLFFTPDDAEEEVAEICGPEWARVAQRGADLGERMRSAFADMMGIGSRRGAILVGSDLPLLTAAVIDEAARALRAGAEVVIGRASDGGYYLLGLTRTCRELFEGIEWGSSRVLAETLRRAGECGLRVVTLAGSFDVDTAEDLVRAERELASMPPDVARSFRAWLATGRF